MCNLNIPELQRIVFCFLTALAVDAVSGPSSVPQQNINDETNEQDVSEQDVNRQDDASVGEDGAVGKAESASLWSLPSTLMFH
jgi:hypothetical protein